MEIILGPRDGSGDGGGAGVAPSRTPRAPSTSTPRAPRPQSDSAYISGAFVTGGMTPASAFAERPQGARTRSTSPSRAASPSRAMSATLPGVYSGGVSSPSTALPGLTQPGTSGPTGSGGSGSSGVGTRPPAATPMRHGGEGSGAGTGTARYRASPTRFGVPSTPFGEREGGSVHRTPLGVGAQGDGVGGGGGPSGSAEGTPGSGLRRQVRHEPHSRRVAVGPGGRSGDGVTPVRVAAVSPLGRTMSSGFSGSWSEPRPRTTPAPSLRPGSGSAFGGSSRLGHTTPARKAATPSPGGPHRYGGSAGRGSTAFSATSFSARSNVVAANKQVALAIDASRRAEDAAQSTSIQMATKDRRIAELEAQVAAREDEARAQEAALDASNAAYVSTKNEQMRDFSSAQRALEATENESNQLLRSNQELRAKVAQMTKEIVAKRQEIANFEKWKLETRKHHARLLQQLEDKENALGQAVSEAADTAEKRASLLSNQVGLSQRLEATERKLDEETAAKLEALNYVADLRAERNTALSKSRSAEASIGTLNARIGDLEKSLHLHIESAAAARHEADVCMERAAMLAKEKQELAAANESVAKEHERLSSRLMEVEAGYLELAASVTGEAPAGMRQADVSKNAGLMQRLVEERARVLSLSSAESAAADERAELRQLVQRLTYDLESAHTLISDMKQQASAGGDRLAERALAAEREASAMRAELQVKVAECSAARSAAKTAESKLAQAQSELASLRALQALHQGSSDEAEKLVAIAAKPPAQRSAVTVADSSDAELSAADRLEREESEELLRTVERLTKIAGTTTDDDPAAVRRDSSKDWDRLKQLADTLAAQSTADVAELLSDLDGMQGGGGGSST